MENGEMKQFNIFIPATKTSKGIMNQMKKIVLLILWS